jgi:hypothetical protein
MPIFNKPSFKFLQFGAHLTADLGPLFSNRPFLLGVLAVRGPGGCKSPPDPRLCLGALDTPPCSLQRPTGSFAGLWQGVLLRVLAPHHWSGQSGPKRQEIPFSRLLFFMLKYPPFMEFYNTIFGDALRGGRGLVHGP